jgi:hypothetical protein
MNASKIEVVGGKGKREDIGRDVASCFRTRKEHPRPTSEPVECILTVMDTSIDDDSFTL